MENFIVKICNAFLEEYFTFIHLTGQNIIEHFSAVS